METRAIVLAAGQGTRMKSDLPKVLHEVRGRSMVSRILDAAIDAGAKGAVVVVGYRRELVETQLREEFGGRPDFELAFAHQAEQLGTAHAVQCALPALADFDGGLMILNGDVPNLSSALLRELVAVGSATPNGVSFVSTVIDEPAGYGRVVRVDGEVSAIVEHRDCTPAQLAIAEINAGFYFGHSDFVRTQLASIDSSNAQREFYLTDLIAIAAKHGGAAAVVAADPREVAGVNDKEQLAAAESFAMTRDHA